MGRLIVPWILWALVLPHLLFLPLPLLGEMIQLAYFSDGWFNHQLVTVFVFKGFFGGENQDVPSIRKGSPANFITMTSKHLRRHGWTPKNIPIKHRSLTSVSVFAWMSRGVYEKKKKTPSATKKTRLLSIESWLVNRDPEITVYEIIPI